ncbi:MAG: hypothetical protein IPN67_10365 [Bacteroidales bacterium]|nr:hypothetical protein [Bacteroidales bacterium]
MKNSILLYSVIFIFFSINGYSQAVLGISAGGGAGKLSQTFTQSGNQVTFSYPGPGAYISGELSWKRVYFDMSLALLFASDNVNLGDDKVDLSDYSTKLALDFTAFSVGYMFPISDRLEAGSALGFHVAAPTLTPNDLNDESKLRFGGYYGLIGLSLVPRIRYSISNSVRITLSIPIGKDFSAMSEDVVVGTVHVGKSAAIVQPESLEPEFKGFTYGMYVSVGYFFKFKDK